MTARLSSYWRRTVTSVTAPNCSAGLATTQPHPLGRPDWKRTVVFTISNDSSARPRHHLLLFNLSDLRVVANALKPFDGHRLFKSGQHVNGQLIAGGPKTVLAQIKRIRDEIGAGIVALTFASGGERDQTLRAMELFGLKVLPHLHEL